MTRARDTADLLTFAPTEQAAESDNALPLIHNGAMMVSQRGTSFASLSSGANYTLDRYMFAVNEGTFTVTQHSDGPTGSGFKKCLKVDCTTADASLTSDGAINIVQRQEGQNLQSMRKGYSDAKKVTWAFWVKTNKTGNYVAELKDHNNTRTVGQVFSVSSADTWEKKVLVFPADTSTSDKFDDDNNKSLSCTIWLAAGTNYTSGTLDTTWADETTANRAAGLNVNIADSTDNEFLTTGWQLEIGEYTATTIPPFQHVNMAGDLMRCFRYFEAHAKGNDQLIGLGGMYTGSHYDCVINTIAEKRTTATLEVPDATNYFQIRIDNEVKTGDTIDTIGGRSFFKRQHLQITSHIPAGISQGENGLLATNNASSYVYVKSEL